MLSGTGLPATRLVMTAGRTPGRNYTIEAFERSISVGRNRSELQSTICALIVSNSRSVWSAAHSAAVDRAQSAVIGAVHLRGSPADGMPPAAHCRTEAIQRLLACHEKRGHTAQSKRFATSFGHCPPSNQVALGTPVAKVRVAASKKGGDLFPDDHGHDNIWPRKRCSSYGCAITSRVEARSRTHFNASRRLSGSSAPKLSSKITSSAFCRSARAM